MPAASPDTRRFRLLPPDDAQGWLPYVWLIYLLPVFITPAQSGRAWQWAAMAVAVPIFLWSYFRGYWLSGRRLLPIIALQCALAVAFAPWNFVAPSFFVYAASFAGRVGRPRVAIGVIIGVVLLVAVTAPLSPRPLAYLGYGAVFSALVGAISVQTAQGQRANARLRLAQDEVRHLAAVAERERIARDLHDVLGHTLSLIVLKSQLAARLAERDPARAAGEIRDVEAVARKALAEVREAIRGYRGSLDDEVARARSLLRAAGIDADVSVELPPMERAAEEALSLALREAVTNTVRHAQATACTIRAHASDGVCTLVVADDGRGGIRAEGNGLRGMRERLEVMGGSVRWACRRGTTLTISVPLSPIDGLNREGGGDGSPPAGLPALAAGGGR